MARTSRKQSAAQTAAPEVKVLVWDAALYVRLSVLDSGKKDGESILNQQEMLERYVAEHPELVLKKVFVDNGETGIDFHRPAWSDLMRECQKGKITCIVLKDLSRLGRTYIETGELLDTILPGLGVRVIAVNDRYDNLNLTNSERMAANLKNLVKGIIAKLNRESGHKSRLARFDTDIEEGERELKRLSSLKQAVFEDYAAKLLTVSEYQFAAEKYNAETAKQQARLESAKREKAEYTQNSTTANKWLSAFTRFMDAKEFTAEMAQALIERVEVSDRNHVTVRFKFRNEYAAISEYSNYTEAA